MSYNVNTWKLKKLENFTIPLKALYVHERKDFHPSKPKILNAETMEVEIDGFGEDNLNAILKDGTLHIKELSVTGEFSGTFLHNVLNPAFKESTGELEAVLIWEGGDSITRLTVKDGNVEETEIEL